MITLSEETKSIETDLYETKGPFNLQVRQWLKNKVVRW